ncbi:hypothetical protein ABZ027_31565 [Streptomyces sp. NPDC006332]|uniref:hypothetical protein n=1 Tax=Streptomyces sp. NPDC006332 TaxID=3155456 RepID=UPI0033B06D4E
MVGTIAKNSRTISFQYYFTDFVTTGTTGAAAMPITTKGNIPQSWPSAYEGAAEIYYGPEAQKFNFSA